MKKVLSIVTVLAVLSLAACSGSGGSDSNPTSGSTASQQGKTYKIVYAATVSTETAAYKAAVTLKKNVESRTNGAVTVDLQFGGTLGGDAEVVDSMSLGTVQMGYITDIGYATCFPELAFVNLPYLFPDYDTVDEHYFNGYLGEKFSALMLDNGLRVLGWGENDYRSLTCNTPVNSKADLAGMKIRTPELDSLVAFFQKLGANPTPMAYSELLTALQQRTVDGQDNGPILTVDGGFYEVQKYFYMTNHVYSGAAIAVNEDFFQSLPEEYQSIIAEEADTAGKTQINENRANVAAAVKKMQDSGMNVVLVLPDALTDDFKAAAHAIWEQFGNQYDSDAMDYIFNNLAN